MLHSTRTKSKEEQLVDTQTIRTGGCLCGAVRYELQGEPFVSGLCHCTTCRKITGSVVSATANWLRDQVKIIGAFSTYDNRQFCPQCGSRLFFLGDKDVEVFLGTLDDAPSGIAPQSEIWTIRRESWLPPLPGVPTHERNRPKT